MSDPVTRRRLLGATAQVAGAVALGAAALPAAALVIVPALQGPPKAWEAVGAPADFTPELASTAIEVRSAGPKVLAKDPATGRVSGGMWFVPPEEMAALLHDGVPAYISWDRYLANQEKLLNK